MGNNEKFKESSEDFNGFRSSVKSAKMKNQQKKQKKDEKAARKLGVSLEEYYTLYANKV